MLEKSLFHTGLAKAAVIVLGFMFLLPASGRAQAIFEVSGVPLTAVRTGYAELLGPIQIIVNSGTTAAATLQVSIAPAVIASPTSAITLNGTGGLSGAALLSVVPDNGLVIISIPAGAGIGSSLTLSGIRTSIPSLPGTSTTLDARLSLTDNLIIANQAVVHVLAGIADPFVVDPTSDSSFTVSLNTVVEPLGSFTFSEGTIHGLTSEVGRLGQTEPSQVVFQLVGLPDGVSVSFPAVIIGSTGATLTAVSNENVTNIATPARKTYVFADSLAGPTAIETFTVTPTVVLGAGSGNGTVFLQVGEGPIALSPTSAVNVVPRYQAQFVPAPSATPIITRTLDFPVSSTNSRVVISNVSSGAASLTLRARQDDGAVIPGAAAVTFNVPSHQTVSLVPGTIFPNTNLNSMRTLEVESQNRRVVGSSLDPAGNLNLFRPLLDEGNIFYLPFDRRTSAEIPVVTVNNGIEPVDLTLTLRSATGQTVASSSRSLLASGALRTGITNLFDVAPGGFGLTGYVVVSAAATAGAVSSPRIRVSLVNHPDANAESVFGVATMGQFSVPIPFFAFGGPYNSSLTLINGSSTVRARVRLIPRQLSGAPLAGTSAISREINPGERMDLDLGQTFGTNPASLTVGYLVLEIDPTNPASPFSGPAPVAGLIHLSTGTPSTAYPVGFNPGTEVFLTPTIDGNEDYTGLAILNSSTAASDVTVELTGSDGVSRGSVTFSVAAGAMRLQLLRELFPNSVPHQDGTVRISSSAAVTVVGIRGSLLLSNLTYLHPQTAPQ